MDSLEIKESLTKELIIDIVSSLGSDYKEDNNGNLIFQTICHNPEGSGSWKLYYYEDNKLFKCFTECGDAFDIFELIQKVKKIPFIQALNYVESFLGFGSRKDGFTQETYDLTDDWDLINKYRDYNKILQKEEQEYEIIPEGIMTLYSEVYPIEWIEEGISIESMEKFNIRMDLYNKRIVMPHYDMNNNLIGIRCRYLDELEINLRGKYNPLYLQTKIYNHNLSHNLYGLNITKEAIMRTKKIIIFESEKSVMKCQDYYGDNNFAVAVCGHSISKHQIDIILGLGVSEVFIAFDKDYVDEESEEGKKCATLILKECYKFAPYVTTYLLWDDNETNLLGYKDSPCDKGKEKLEMLMKNKFEIRSKEGEKVDKKRRTNKNRG